MYVCIYIYLCMYVCNVCMYVYMLYAKDYAYHYVKCMYVYTMHVCINACMHIHVCM